MCHLRSGTVLKFVPGVKLCVLKGPSNLSKVANEQAFVGEVLSFRSVHVFSVVSFLTFPQQFF